MLPQAHSGREFAISRLFDVVHYRDQMHPSPRRASTQDVAYFEIKTEFNTYELAFGSAYAPVPGNAPLNARQLGWIEFSDTAGDFYVLDAKGDHVLEKISTHIHRRELRDALAKTKRELAEAGPQDTGQIRIKLADLIERGKKWGIEASMPPALATTPAEPNGAQVASAPPVSDQEVAPVSAPMPPASAPAPHVALDGSEPFVGAHVLFVTNPGEQISGMQELPAVIVRVHPDRKHVSLLVFIDDSETVHRLNIPRRGSDAGGGRLHQFGVWDFNPSWLADQARLRALEESVAAIAALTDRITALESASTKPRRGRLAKQEGGESDSVTEAEQSASEPDLIEKAS